MHIRRWESHQMTRYEETIFLFIIVWFSFCCSFLFSCHFSLSFLSFFSSVPDLPIPYGILSGAQTFFYPGARVVLPRAETMFVVCERKCPYGSFPSVCLSVAVFQVCIYGPAQVADYFLSVRCFPFSFFSLFFPKKIMIPHYCFFFSFSFFFFFFL